MSTRRQLRAALATTTRPDRDGPPHELLAFRLRDWMRPTDSVPDVADLDVAFTHRASAARRRWTDAARAWAATNGISDRDWLDHRRTSQPRRTASP